MTGASRAGMEHDWYPAEHGLRQCGTRLMTRRQSTDVPDGPSVRGGLPWVALNAPSGEAM